MKNFYVLASRTSLESRVNDRPYFKSHSYEHPQGQAATWCQHITDAKTFSSEKEAWEFAYDIWGMRFAKQQFFVIAVQDKAWSASLARRKELENDSVSSNRHVHGR